MGTTFEITTQLTTFNCGKCGGVYAISERFREEKHSKGVVTCEQIESEVSDLMRKFWKPSLERLKAERDGARASLKLQEKRDSKRINGLLGMNRRLMAENAQLRATIDEMTKGVEADRNELSRCTWTEDNDGVWSSECGLVWSFENGKVCENNVTYCMRCGRLVDAHEYDPETEQ